jgi:ankyrin repeat protein
LLENGSAPLVNCRNFRGDTPLHLSTTPETSRLLIQCKAETNATNRNGETPLLYAAYYRGNASQCRVLLENGADPNLKDREGRSLRNYSAIQKALADMSPIPAIRSERLKSPRGRQGDAPLSR